MLVSPPQPVKTCWVCARRRLTFLNYSLVWDVNAGVFYVLQQKETGTHVNGQPQQKNNGGGRAGVQEKWCASVCLSPPPRAGRQQTPWQEGGWGGGTGFWGWISFIGRNPASLPVLPPFPKKKKAINKSPPPPRGLARPSTAPRRPPASVGSVLPPREEAPARPGPSPPLPPLPHKGRGRGIPWGCGGVPHSPTHPGLPYYCPLAGPARGGYSWGSRGGATT